MSVSNDVGSAMQLSRYNQRLSAKWRRKLAHCWRVAWSYVSLWSFCWWRCLTLNSICDQPAVGPLTWRLSRGRSTRTRHVAQRVRFLHETVLISAPETYQRQQRMCDNISYRRLPSYLF